MTKGSLLALVLLSLSSSFSFAQTSQLIITEVFPDPKAVGDSDGEWFEIYNPGDQPISLKNFILRDDGRDSHKIDSELTINPKGYLVFCKNNNSEQNGGMNCNYQYSKFSLANESDEIILEKDGEVARLVYSKSTHPVKSGKSMELDGSTWHASTNQFGKGDYGTPGSGNSSPPAPTQPPQPSATNTPKPTKASTATVKPTEGDNVKAQVLANQDESENQEEKDEVKPTASQLVQNIQEATPVVESEVINLQEENKGPNVIQNILMWGGVLSMMGAIGSYLWVSNNSH